MGYRWCSSFVNKTCRIFGSGGIRATRRGVTIVTCPDVRLPLKPKPAFTIVLTNLPDYLLHFFPTVFLTMFPAEDPTCSRPFHDILHIPCHRERHEISATELVVTFVLHSHRAVQTSETIFQCFPLGKRLRNQPAMDGMVPNRTAWFIRTACILAWHIVRRNRYDLEHDTHKHAATVWAGH